MHWLLTPPQPHDVPRLIIWLGRRYVRYINKTYHRTGTLWDSRYKSSRSTIRAKPEPYSKGRKADETRYFTILWKNLSSQLAQ